MIYVSCQPDSTRFIWEIQTQHINFENNGVDLSKVYALFGFRESPSNELLNLKQQLGSNIILIEDTREDLRYSPSIQPHLLKKFFKSFPNFVNERTFYHDSDVLFTYSGLPNFNEMNETDYWYVSDCRSYLNYDYIIKTGIDILLDMCEIVGISPIVVRRNNNHTGGCHHFIYGTDYTFWDECERVQTKLFELEKKNDFYANQWAICSKNSKENHYKFQYWVMGMIAFQWVAWKRGFDTRIHEDLNFEWGSSYNSYDKSKIFHNAGVLQGNSSLFSKLDYNNKFPYNEDFSRIDKNSNTYFYVKELIKAGKKLGYIK